MGGKRKLTDKVRICPYCKQKFRPLADVDIFCGRRCYVAARRAEGWRTKCNTTDRS